MIRILLLTIIALFFLCGIAAAQTTQQNGDWHDPNIWDVVPTGAVGETATINHAVSIRQDATAYDVQINGSLKQYQATLSAREIINNGLLVQYPGHHLVFRDAEGGGALFNRGNWIALGWEKTTNVRSTHALEAGATTVSVNRPLTNWQVGDTLLIPPTKQLNTNLPLNSNGQIKELTEIPTGEFVTIVSVDYPVVTFAPPLAEDHPGVAPNPWGVERYPHVINMSRNSKWTSETFDNPGHTRSEFGGYQLTQHVEIDGVGRTRGDMQIETPEVPNGNEIGKYPIHYHQDASGKVTGVTIRNPRKWGIAIHGVDDVTVRNSCVHGANGCYVTEDGTEQRYRFLDCVSVAPVIGHNVLNAGIKLLPGGVVDIAQEGGGFWIRGTGGDLINCTAYGGNNGIVLNGYKAAQIGGARPYRVDGEIVYSKTAPYRGIIRNLEVIAAWTGFYSVYPQQFPGPNVDGQRQEIENVLIANCHKNGGISYHDGIMDWINWTVIFDEATTNSNVNNGPTQIANYRHTLGWKTNGSYENTENTWSDFRVSGAVLAMQGPKRTNGFFNNAGVGGRCVMIGGQFATQYGIIFPIPSDLQGAGEVEFTATGIQFLENGVDNAPNWGYGGNKKYAIGTPWTNPPTEEQNYYDIIIDGFRIWSYYDTNTPEETFEVPDWHGLIE